MNENRQIEQLVSQWNAACQAGRFEEADKIYGDIARAMVMINNTKVKDKPLN